MRRHIVGVGQFVGPFVEIDLAQRIGKPCRLGGLRRLSHGGEEVFEVDALCGPLRNAHDRDEGDFQRRLAHALRHRPQSLPSRHDREHAADGVCKSVFDQFDDRPQLLQPLQIALGQFQFVARLYAGHLRDRHEHVDEQAAVDARRDQRNVLGDAIEPRRVDLEQRMKPDLAVGSCGTIRNHARHNRGRLILEFNRRAHRRPHAFFQKLTFAQGLLLNLQIVRQRIHAERARVGFVGNFRGAWNKEWLFVKAAQRQRLFGLVALEPIDLAEREMLWQDFKLFAALFLGRYRKVRFGCVGHDVFLIDLAFLELFLHALGAVIETEHFDNLQHREREFAIDGVDFQPRADAEIIFARTRRIEPDDVLIIFVDVMRVLPKHGQVLEPLRHFRVEIRLAQNVFNVARRVGIPLLAIGIDLDPFRRAKHDPWPRGICQARPHARRARSHGDGRRGVVDLVVDRATSR